MLFANEELNKTHRILWEEDCEIVHSSYRGKLSEIPTAEILDKMIERGSNLVERIPAEGDATPPATTKPRTRKPQADTTGSDTE